MGLVYFPTFGGFFFVNVGINIPNTWMPWDCLFWTKKRVMWGSLFFENGHSVEKKSKQTRLELVSTFLWTKKYDAVVSSLQIQCWKAFLTCKDGGIWTRIWTRWLFGWCIVSYYCCYVPLFLVLTSCSCLLRLHATTHFWVGQQESQKWWLFIRNSNLCCS